MTRYCNPTRRFIALERDMTASLPVDHIPDALKGFYAVLG